MTPSEILLRDLNRAAKRFWNFHKTRYGVTPRYLSWLAINNPNLPERLAAGGSVSPAVEKRLRDFITKELDKQANPSKAARTKMRLTNGAVLGRHTPKPGTQ